MNVIIKLGDARLCLARSWNSARAEMAYHQQTVQCYDNNDASPRLQISEASVYLIEVGDDLIEQA